MAEPPEQLALGAPMSYGPATAGRSSSLGPGARPLARRSMSPGPAGVLRRAKSPQGISPRLRANLAANDPRVAGDLAAAQLSEMSRARDDDPGTGVCNWSVGGQCSAQ